MHPAKTAIIIAGPTGVGKTAVAIELAKQLGTAIVSADSRQCYHGMAIGTAQPSPQQLQAVKHYFVNEYPVTAALNASDYEQHALKYLEDIFATKDTAVACGGTGLYIRALCAGLDEMPAIDERVEQEVNEAFKQDGLSWLQTELHAADPEIFKQIDTNNPARLIRALVFRRSTGKSLLSYQSRAAKSRPFHIRKIGLELPREQLYTRIDKRVDQMMEAGLLDEARSLLLYRNLKNLQTVGYTELFDFLDGNTTLESAVSLIKQHSRNYAKRQLTWFKKDPEFLWLHTDEEMLSKR